MRSGRWGQKNSPNSPHSLHKTAHHSNGNMHFTQDMFDCIMNPHEASVENCDVSVRTVPHAVGVGSHA